MLQDTAGAWMNGAEFRGACWAILKPIPTLCCNRGLFANRNRTLRRHVTLFSSPDPLLPSQNYMTRFARRAADVAGIEKEETRAAAAEAKAASILVP